MLPFIARVTIKSCSKEPVAVPRGAPEALRSLGPREEGAGSLMTCGFVTWKTFVCVCVRERERMSSTAASLMSTKG